VLECGEPTQRNVLGPSDARQICHRAGDEFDAARAQFRYPAGEIGLPLGFAAHRHSTSSDITSLRLRYVMNVS
jgi:hypothetical protein